MNETDLIIVLEPLEDYEIEEEYLDFEWAVTYFTEEQMIVQLNFSYPMEISNRVKVKVVFKNESEFQELQQFETIETNYTIQKTLPAQINKDPMSQFIDGAADSFEASMTIVTSGAIAVNLVMSTSLQSVWGAINALQMIIHIPLMNIVLPSNAIIFFETLINMVQMDIIPSERVNDLMFNFSNSNETYNEYFELMGYSGKSAIVNLESLYLFIMITIGIILVMIPLKYLAVKHPLSHKLYRIVAMKIGMATLLRLVLEGYLELCLSSFVNLLDLRFTNASDVYSSLVCVLALCLVLLYPIFLLKFVMFASSSQLDAELHQSRYGTLYMDLKYDRKDALLYYLIFMMRRQIFTILAVFGQDYGSI